jgi:hypothetical protein
MQGPYSMCLSARGTSATWPAYFQIFAFGRFADMLGIGPDRMV